MIGNGLVCNSYEVGDSVLKSFASFAKKVKLSKDELTWTTEKGKFYSIIDLLFIIELCKTIGSLAERTTRNRFGSPPAVQSRSSQSAPHQLVNHETFPFFPFEIYWLAGSRRISDWIPITLLPHGQVSLRTVPVTNPIQKIPKSGIWTP